jgi:hypothetical protein
VSLCAKTLPAIPLNSSTGHARIVRIPLQYQRRNSPGVRRIDTMAMNFRLWY